MKIIFLEKRISHLENKLKDYKVDQEKYENSFELLSKNFLLFSTTLKEKVIIQQHIAEQMVTLSESIDAIETAINPSRKIGYDITKDPYN